MGEVSDEASDVFDTLITRALEKLPPEFRAQIDSVAIVVDDIASPEQLAATHSHGLYGIYQGVPRTAYGAESAPLPSKITLFRAPLIASSRGPDELAKLVEETLFHEIAHHLGISDQRLHELAEGRQRSAR
jgi:predicted Zn-dependent protease with MMP-like domain